MEIMKGYLACISLIGTIGSLTSTDPCSTKSFGPYESFITNIREDTPVGAVIGLLDLHGTKSEITLQQQANTHLRLELPSRNITLQSQLDTDKGISTLFFYTICSPIAEPSTTEMNFMDTTFHINCTTSTEYAFTFNVKDTTRPMQVTVTVRVLLVDVNDHPPTFPKGQYTVNISEDTTTGTTIFQDAKAHDGDLAGDGNDLFSYYILPGPFSDYFEFEYPLYPDLTLKKKMDYEKTASMEIEIMAKDDPFRGKSLNSTAKLKINVLDADDLNPVFLQNQYFGTVSGNALPGSTVTITPAPISAVDQDALNAELKYELIDPNGHFTINEQTGVVSVDVLPSSDTSVVLKAVQVDNPFRWCIATLVVEITGITTPPVKNETIRFQFQLYQVTISESIPVGTVVKTLQPLGVTTTIPLVYSILESQNLFSIESSGDIVLTNKLDYEQQYYHQITISVSDGQDTAITIVNFTVTDVNDNNPEIETQAIALSADRIQGTALTVIKVTDKDPNSHFTFQLLSHTRLFAIDSYGEVSIIGAAEDLIADTYVLTISVKDNGVPVRESIALVTVHFPATSKPVSSARIMTESSDILAIGLGVTAALLFIVVILLLVYIIRRRLYADEQLDKVKHQRGMNPRGLTYRPGDPSPVPSHFDLKFNGELEETSEIDGSTSIQDNPLSDNRYRYGYPNLNGGVDMDAGDEEIHLDTAIVPFEREDYFRSSGRMKTFGHDECNSSDNSYASDSTGDSNKGLMKNLKKQALSNGSEKIGNTNRLPSYMSDSVLDSRLGQKPTKEKPEITVYF